MRKRIRRILAGDTEAFSQLVMEHQSMLIAFAAFRIPDRNLVDEVVQETFIRAYETLGEYDPDKDFATWLRVICRYRILTELKRRSRASAREVPYSEDVEGFLADRALARVADEGDGAEGLMTHLDDCVGKLGGKARALLASRYDDDRSLQEIAESLDRTVNWVTTNLCRIRQQLKRCVETKMGPA